MYPALLRFPRLKSFTSYEFRQTTFKPLTHSTHLNPFKPCLLPSSHLSSFSLLFTMVQNNQESRLHYWATSSPIFSFTRAAHSFAFSVLALLASLTLRCAHSFIRSLAPFTHSLTRGTVNDKIAIFSEFLDAPSHLYTRLCPSVRRSVRPSVRPSPVIFQRLLGAS